VHLTDEDIQRAFDFLRDSAPKIAAARANKVRTEERRKIVWSHLRRSCKEGTQAERDAYAYAHENYEKHIEDMSVAVEAFELLRAQREAANAKIEAWRTSSANERGAARAAG